MKTVINFPASVDEETLIELSELLKMLGDVSRLKILVVCLKEPTCVTDIVAQVGLSQSLVSHHLRLLRATRLLKTQKKGRQTFYALADEHIRCILVDLIDHVVESDREP